MSLFNNRNKGLKGIITFLSCSLIILLAIANNGAANDDHFSVIELILNLRSFPDSTVCWQCYHPKLYHSLVALIWGIFGIKSLLWQQLTAQLLNAAFGIATVLIIRKYIFKLPFKSAILLVAFALLVLNPRFISIFSQATNDGIIIFMGNLGVLALLKLYKKPSLKYSLVLVAAIGLGAMTKLNFGVYLIGAVVTLIVLVIVTKNYSFSLKRGYLGTLLFIFIFTGYALLGFNGYYKNLKKESSALTYNTPLYELPHLYEYGDYYIPGIQTIYSGYFKFHYFDLIKYPELIVVDNEIRRNKHVNSHFSQLYGRTHYLYFDQWPEEWQTSSVLMSRVGSVSLAIAIVPTLILILGIFIMLKRTFISIKNKGVEAFKMDDNWIILLLILGYLMFSVLFSLFGRTYVFMKVIYLLPGLILMAKPLLIGHNYLFNLIKSKKFENAYAAFIGILCTLYMIPLVHLIIRMFQDKIALYF